MNTFKSKLNTPRLLSLIVMAILILLYSCEKEDTPNELVIPVAAFIADEVEVDQGTNVSFTDLSTNSPTSWLWDFGDGATSNSPNPTHLYGSAGSFTVSLIVTNDDGSDEEIKENYITVTESIETVIDIDGNEYSTIKIGSQVWMAENLKVTRLPDGTELNYISDDYEWNLLEDNNIDMAYCYYNNDGNGEKDIYGALYTWSAAMNGSDASSLSPSGVQGICPDGWHLPSDNEWWTMINELGGKTIAGGKLKESGTEHWVNNEGATNESGFTALPGGYRNASGGSFYTINHFGYWWSSSEEFESTGWSFVMNNMNSQIDSEGQFKSTGMSVRCVKD